MLNTCPHAPLLICNLYFVTNTIIKPIVKVVRNVDNININSSIAIPINMLLNEFSGKELKYFVPIINIPTRMENNHALTNSVNRKLVLM